FSTAWDIVRKHPAVLFHTATGRTRIELSALRLDMPMIVGPLPHSDGFTMERAYLEAIAAADPSADLHTASLVVIEAERYLVNPAALEPLAEHLVLRLDPEHLTLLDGEEEESETLRQALRKSRIVELVWSPDLDLTVKRVMNVNRRLKVSIFIDYGAFVAPGGRGANGGPAG